MHCREIVCCSVYSRKLYFRKDSSRSRELYGIFQHFHVGIVLYGVFPFKIEEFALKGYLCRVLPGVATKQGTDELFKTDSCSGRVGWYDGDNNLPERPRYTYAQLAFNCRKYACLFFIDQYVNYSIQALAFHKRLRVQSHVDAAEILGSEDIRCGLEECNISHRIPNLSRSSTLVVQHEARKLLVHICFDQARRLHVERYKCAPALPDTANYEEQQEYYDVLFTLIISSEESLQLHYGFLKNLALKSFFHRFSHVVGNGRLAMAIYHYGVEKTKLTLNMVAFCGGMVSFFK